MLARLQDPTSDTVALLPYLPSLFWGFFNVDICVREQAAEFTSHELPVSCYPLGIRVFYVIFHNVVVFRVIY